MSSRQHLRIPVSKAKAQSAQSLALARQALLVLHLAMMTAGPSKLHQAQKVGFPIRSFPVLVAKNPCGRKRAGAPKSQLC